MTSAIADDNYKETHTDKYKNKQKGVKCVNDLLWFFWINFTQLNSSLNVIFFFSGFSTLMSMKKNMNTDIPAEKSFFMKLAQYKVNRRSI